MYNKPLWGSALALLSASTYALLPLFTVRGFDAGLSIGTLLFMRFLMAASCLWAIVFIKKTDWRLDFEQMKVLVPATLVGICAGFFAFFHAYQLMSPSMATILFYMYPVFVFVFESVVQKKPLHFYKVLALLLALAGMMLIVWDGNAAFSILGVMLSIGAGIGYAGFCGSLEMKPLQKVDAYVLSAWVATIATGVFMVTCLIQGQPLLSKSPEGWLYAGLLAIICTVVATVTIYTAIRWIGASNAAVIATAEPVIVFVFGYFFLKEVQTPNIALGIMLVVAGLLAMQWPVVKKGVLRKQHRAYVKGM